MADRLQLQDSNCEQWVQCVFPVLFVCDCLRVCVSVCVIMLHKHRL